MPVMAGAGEPPPQPGRPIRVFATYVTSTVRDSDSLVPDANDCGPRRDADERIMPHSGCDDTRLLIYTRVVLDRVADSDVGRPFQGRQARLKASPYTFATRA